MYYWIYQDSENNQRIADSSAGYQNKEQCRDDIERVKTTSNAIVKEGPSSLGTRKGSPMSRAEHHK
jgi:uncharacterized protein YegP (UPF0339 family)